MMPKVKLLKEDNVRKGFIDRDVFAAILTNLPKELQPPLKFAHATGWRFKSEVLALTAERVDLKAGDGSPRFRHDEIRAGSVVLPDRRATHARAGADRRGSRA